MTWLFVGLGVLVVVGAAALILIGHGGKEKHRGQIPFYQKRSSLLNENQRRYYDTLLQVVGDKSLVFPKVRASDLVNPPPSSPHSFRVHWQRVQRRHVDFLICTPANLTPTLAIRLETRAEKKRRLQSGPDVVDDVVDMAQIPFLRVEMVETYEASRIARDIRNALARGGEIASTNSGDSVQHNPRSAQLRQVAQERMPTFSRWSSVLWGLLSGNSKQVKI